MRRVPHRSGWLIALLIFYAAAAPSVVGAVMLSGRLGAAGLGFGEALLWQGVVWFSWVALAPLIFRLGHPHRLRGEGWLAPLPAYLAGGIVVVALHATLAAVMDWLMDPTVGSRFADAFPALFTGRLPIDILTYSAILGVVYAVEYSAQLREKEYAAAQVESELLRAQLHALKMQLHPHFLFNALQSLATLIRHDPDRAVKMTVLLGDLLRATLGRAASQLVPLRDELQLVEQYLAIERIRFGDELHVTIEAERATLDCMVPDLILQPLVENAIRHGLAPVSGERRLEVRARLDGRLHLEVVDSGIGLERGRATAGTGLGLRTTRQRLCALYGDDFTLDVRSSENGSGTTARITIPSV